MGDLSGYPVSEIIKITDKINSLSAYNKKLNQYRFIIEIGRYHYLASPLSGFRVHHVYKTFQRNRSFCPAVIFYCAVIVSLG